MKTFKQFLKENEESKNQVEENEEKEKLDEAKIDREYLQGTEICFDSIGSGFNCSIDPFAGELGNFNDSYSHRFSISVYSSGSVDYYKEPTNEEIEMMEKVKNKEIDFKKGPRYIIIQEMKKAMNNEILKAAAEFDKKIEAILKKHGYKKS